MSLGSGRARLKPDGSNADRRRWIHLDLKGAIPTVPRLLEWLDYFRKNGFAGVLIEAEDRYPWRCWEGLYRPGYSLEDWRQITAQAASLGLSMAPLIQIQGHLEWVLRHPRYASWRENGHVNELCPQHPEAGRHLGEWIDEACTVFAQAGIIHLGADETWNLASCPQCRARADAHPDGKMGVYLEQVSRFCKHVVDKGLRPMIWADMFWRTNRPDLASRLPPGTILVDWQYHGQGPYANTTALAASGLEIWGASALRCAHDITQTMAPLAPRRENVIGWEQQLAEGKINGLIHTNWGRSRSTCPCYGPWEGWLPALMPGVSSLCQDAAELSDQVLRAAGSEVVTPLLQRLEALDSAQLGDPFERAALDWWRLSARHRMIFLDAAISRAGWAAYSADSMATADDCRELRYFQELRSALRRHLSQWERDARLWWTARGWSDADEYFASRLAAPREFLL